jgi:DNA replication and repair protein RecF
MRVQRLSLTQFRNYERLDLDVAPGVTVLWGDNAQGKSNLLEAVYYLATMRSFRARSDRDLIRWNQQSDPLAFTRLAARVERSGESFDLDVVLREEARPDDDDTPSLSKRIKLNDLARRAIDVVGTATAVMFSPQDLHLIDGAPALRRRYLDVTLSQEDRRYCRTLAHYNRVLVQRNHLLRAARERGSKPDEMHFWNRELITAGSYLLARRMATMRRLAGVARDVYATVGGTSEELDVGYKNSVFGAGDGLSDAGADDIASAFEARLADVQSKEFVLGVSLVGPHRDDVTLRIAGHDVGEFGSRGQQRLAALALKVAETEHLFTQTGEHPILLLDDVLSELDPRRRDHVLGLIRAEQQVFITSAEPAALGGVPSDANWLRVAQGRLAPVLPGVGNLTD